MPRDGLFLQRQLSLFFWGLYYYDVVFVHVEIRDRSIFTEKEALISFMKRILILGNGFDLAHNLPTRYADFLNFCKHVQLIWTYGIANGNRDKDFQKDHIDNWETDESIRLEITEAFKERKFNNGIITLENHVLSEIHSLLTDNVWYEYFNKLYDEKLMNGENWIDFESEIRDVIKAVDEGSHSLTDSWADVSYKISSSKFLIDGAEVPKTLSDEKEACFEESINFGGYLKGKGYDKGHEITIRDFRDKTYEDLERLTRALELYLAYFINIIPMGPENRIKEISDIHPDYVLNFNYTNTYERIYKEGDVYHIHGKADEERLPEYNNMVLGIDEYWPEDLRDTHTNFTIFKKFAQRIQKHTGNENYKWLNEINSQYKNEKNNQAKCKDPLKEHVDGISYIYVYGHSLNITDKDILSELLKSDATAVTVYCPDKETEGELIANTIGLITEQRLLEKANYVPAKFDFQILKH